MTAISIAMIGMLAMLSLLAAVILRRPWQKWLCLGLAGSEVAMLIFLVVFIIRG